MGFYGLLLLRLEDDNEKRIIKYVKRQFMGNEKLKTTVIVELYERLKNLKIEVFAFFNLNLEEKHRRDHDVLPGPCKRGPRNIDPCVPVDNCVRGELFRASTS